MIALLLVQALSGQTWFDPKLQALIIAILNAVIIFLKPSTSPNVSADGPPTHRKITFTI